MSYEGGYGRTTGKRRNQREEPEVRVHVQRVSQAAEVPSYKNLSRFDHVPLAVINPSPMKKRPNTSLEDHRLEPAANKVTLKPKRYEKKELPDHLIHAPIDKNATTKVRKVFVDTKGMTSKQKKDAMLAAQKQAQEAKKNRRIQANLKNFFSQIKAALDSRKDDELIHDSIRARIGEAKTKIEDKRFITYLMKAFFGRGDVSVIYKQEFAQFFKLFVKDVTENELLECMAHYGGKRSRNDSNDDSIASSI